MKKLTAMTAVFLSVTAVLSVSMGTIPSAYAAEEDDLLYAPPLPAVNSQLRHQTCTALSEQAKAYYSGTYSYTNLSALNGAEDDSTSEAAAKNNALFDALHTLMAETHQNYTGYSGTKPGSLAYYWASTDAVGGSSTYTMFYSDISADAESVALNREHIWPKSRASFQTSRGGADLHHLRPATEVINKAKSDHAFGYIDGTYTKDFQSRTYMEAPYWLHENDDLFECKDDVKGDVARILLYVYCRWEQPNLYTDIPAERLPNQDPQSTDNGKKVMESLDTLLQWCECDPVDTWEMERNDLTQQVQGNRNVFIDYPELAWQLFGAELPKGMATPTRQGCTHHYVVSERREASCDKDGMYRLVCEKCGDENHRRLAHTGHENQDADAFCDHCGEAVAYPVPFTRAASPESGDHLLLVHPASNTTAGRTVSAGGKLATVPVKTNKDTVYAPFDSAVLHIEKTENGTFLLQSDGKYLTSAQGGNKLEWMDVPEHCSEWRVEPSETAGEFYIANAGAVSSDKPQYLEYYSGELTTYSKSAKPAFRFALFTVQAHLWDEATGRCQLCGEIRQEPGFLLGDVNGDGKIDITDATLIQKYAAETEDLTTRQLLAADTNADGNVNVADATRIQNLIAELTDDPGE